MPNLLHNPFYRAQSLLARRAHSAYELRSKLKQRRFSPAEIDSVITKLIRLNLINDQEFASSYARQLLAIKPVGPKFISYKLKQKGIKSETINEVIQELFPPGREQELAQLAANRWRRTHESKKASRNPSPPPLIREGNVVNPPDKGDRGGFQKLPKANNQNRLTRYLMARGFSSSVINISSIDD